MNWFFSTWAIVKQKFSKDKFCNQNIVWNYLEWWVYSDISKLLSLISCSRWWNAKLITVKPQECVESCLMNFRIRENKGESPKLTGISQTQLPVIGSVFFSFWLSRSDLSLLFEVHPIQSTLHLSKIVPEFMI